MPHAYSPAVLIVDDDRAMTAYLREQFHEQTSVGVLVANDLVGAKDILDNEEIGIDAILVNIFFEKIKIAPDLNLYDGLDLLNYCKTRRSGVKMYVLSFWVDQENMHEMAKKSQLEIEHWLHKMFYVDKSDPKTPWAVIERDMIKSRFEDILRQATHLGVDAPKDLDALSEFIRTNIRPAVRTYIQSTEYDTLLIKQPIEVIVSRDEDGLFRSYARKIGLLLEGIGETVEDSLADLTSIIFDQCSEFAAEQDDRVLGYARVVRDQLAAYVVSRT